MKDPAFLFYSSDFLSETILMTNEQVGQYIKLLCLQHQKGHLKEKDMLNICNSYDEDIFSKFQKDSENNFYNERLENEINRRKAYSESRRNNRKKKDLIPEGNKTYQKDMFDICNSYVKHMGTETGAITKTINKKDNRGMGEEEKTKKKTLDDVLKENRFSKELENTLREFAEMRKTIKKPMTARALELLLKNLDRLTNLEAEKIEILNQSIEHSWQTVYPLKNEPNSNAKEEFLNG